MLCTGAARTVNDEQMAEQLDRQRVRVILKPFNIDELLGVLAELLAAQALLDQASDEQAS